VYLEDPEHLVFLENLGVLEYLEHFEHPGNLDYLIPEHLENLVDL
jgi:hypothetical protein